MSYFEPADPLTNKAPEHQDAALEAHRKNLSAYGRTTIKPNRTYEIIVSKVVTEHPITLIDKRGTSHVVHDGYTIRHHTANRTNSIFRDILADIKAIPGRRYHQDKYWWVPVESQSELYVFMQKYSLDIIPPEDHAPTPEHLVPVPSAEEEFKIGELVDIHWTISSRKYHAEGTITNINEHSHKMKLTTSPPTDSLFTKGEIIEIVRKGQLMYDSDTYISKKTISANLQDTNSAFHVGDIVTAHWNIGTPTKHYEHDIKITEIEPDYIHFELQSITAPFVLDGHTYDSGDRTGFKFKYPFPYPKYYMTAKTQQAVEDPALIFDVGDFVMATWGDDIDHTFHVSGKAQVVSSTVDYWAVRLTNDVTDGTNTWPVGKIINYDKSQPFTYYKNLKHLAINGVSGKANKPYTMDAVDDFFEGDIALATWEINGKIYSSKVRVISRTVTNSKGLKYYSVALMEDLDSVYTVGVITTVPQKSNPEYSNNYRLSRYIEDEPDEPPIPVTLSQSERDSANKMYDNIYNNVFGNLLSAITKKPKFFQPGDIVLAKFVANDKKYSFKGKVLENDFMGIGNVPYYRVELLEAAHPYFIGYDATIRREDHPQWDEDNRLVAFSPGMITEQQVQESIDSLPIAEEITDAVNLSTKERAVKFLEESYINQVKSEGKKQVDINNVAKMIKQILKIYYPSVKFSVRTSKYSGGHSIDVRWDFGPPSKLVDQLIGKYHDKVFDGQTDSSSYLKTPWNNDGVSAQRDIPQDFWLAKAVEIAAKHHKTISPTYDDVHKTMIGSEYLSDLVSEELNNKTF